MRKVKLRAKSKAPIARSKSARASRMPAAASEEPAPSPRQRRKSRYRPAGTQRDGARGAASQSNHQVEQTVNQCARGSRLSAAHPGG